jgi:hypothetical protein
MFSKIKEFLFGKVPEQAPTVAPYKVETAPVAAAPAVEAVVTPDTVVIKPEAVAPNLVPDTISTELAPAVETVSAPVVEAVTAPVVEAVTEPTLPEVAAPKSAAKRGAAKVTAKPKAPKAPRKPRSKKA